MQLLNPADVRYVIELRLATTVTSVSPLAGSVANCSYRVESAAGSMVVKSCSETDWLNETTALTRLAASPSIPIPTLLGFGHIDGSPWLALRWIDGGPATTPTSRREAGRAVQALHQLEAQHFGSSGDPADSWSDVLTRTLADDLDTVLSAGLITPATASAIARRVATTPPYAGPPRMLHGDLKDMHFHTSAGSLMAILDWGDATAGDPLYDVARYSLEGPDALVGLLEGYGTLDLDTDTMRAYRLRFTTGCLADEVRCNGDWFKTYLGRIRHDL